MRILVIHTVYKFKGGEDTVVANEISLLRAAGHEVELLEFSNTGGTLMKLAQLPFNFSAYANTKKAAKDFRPEVAHIHNLHFAGSASVLYALKACQIPAVMTLHNYRLLCPTATLFNKGQLYMDSVHRAFNWGAVRKGVYQNSGAITFWVMLSMWLHQQAGSWKIPSAYICLGQFTRDLFRDSKMAELEDQMVIKPNFSYPNTSSPNREKRTAFLYVGRLSEEKGISVMLQAFSKNKLPLVIAGTGPLETEVAHAAMTQPHIEFLGPVTKEKVNDLLLSARALVFPSLWYETFGMVIAEAFASGTPVIASGLGQLNFTVKEGYNGLHFKCGDPDALSETAQLFYDLPENLYAAYRENALLTYLENYTPEKNLGNLVAIYMAAIGEAGRSSALP